MPLPPVLVLVLVLMLVIVLVLVLVDGTIIVTSCQTSDNEAPPKMPATPSDYHILPAPRRLPPVLLLLLVVVVIVVS